MLSLRYYYNHFNQNTKSKYHTVCNLVGGTPYWFLNA